MSLVLSSHTPRAAKEHRCYLCNRTIDVGEKHVLINSISPGDFCSFRMHAACDAFADKIYHDEDDWEFHDPCEFRELMAQEGGVS